LIAESSQQRIRANVSVYRLEQQSRRLLVAKFRQRAHHYHECFDHVEVAAPVHARDRSIPVLIDAAVERLVGHNECEEAEQENYADAQHCLEAKHQVN
jgi:hypothetical protein